MEFYRSKESISEEHIEGVESSLGISLPEAYKEIMLKYSGGAPERKYFLSGREGIILTI